jgi:hypothetical protein
MKPQVMVSSVTKDRVPLGNVGKLAGVWFESEKLGDRLKAAGLKSDAGTLVPFEFIRSEIKRHLVGKYAWEVYLFEDKAGQRSGEHDTLDATKESQLVIGIFGQDTGWQVGDHDPLTPTLREWRKALATPLKFRLFWWKDSVASNKISGETGEVLRALVDYVGGKMYSKFSDTVDLFQRLDRTVQDYMHQAVFRYVKYAVPTEDAETEDWLLSAYRSRQTKMQAAFEKQSQTFGMRGNVIQIATGHDQPIALHCAPDSFSIPESRKFAAYVFDDEASERRVKDMGRLHFVAVFGNVTENQIRRHLGNFEAAEVFRAEWGYFGMEPNTGIQAVYLPHCTNSLVMQTRMSEALEWLKPRSEKIAELALYRQQLLDLSQSRTAPDIKKAVKKVTIGRP